MEVGESPTRGGGGGQGDAGVAVAAAAAVASAPVAAATALASVAAAPSSLSETKPASREQPRKDEAENSLPSAADEETREGKRDSDRENNNKNTLQGKAGSGQCDKESKMTISSGSKDYDDCGATNLVMDEARMSGGDEDNDSSTGSHGAPMNLSPKVAKLVSNGNVSEDEEEAMNLCSGEVTTSSAPPRMTKEVLVAKEKPITTSMIGLSAKMRLKKQRLLEAARVVENMQTDSQNNALPSDGTSMLVAAAALAGNGNNASNGWESHSALHRLAEAAERKQVRSKKF